MLRLGRQLGERHLVRAEGALDRLAVDLLRAGPALWACAARSSASAAARERRSLRASCWIARISAMHRVERRRPCSWCIELRVVAFDEVGLVAVAREEAGRSSSSGMRASTVGPAIL